MIPAHLQTMTNQQLAALSTDHNRWLAVQAGAGAGKTAVLSARYVLLIEQGVPIDQIVAITFTRKAAREMQGRVQRYISLRIQEFLAAGQPPESEAYSRLLNALERFHLNRISTIDSFCRSLLAEFSMEAGIDPGIGIIDENVEERLRADFLRDVSRKLAQQPPQPDEEGMTPLVEAFATLHDWLSNRDVLGIISRIIGDDGSLAAALRAWGGFATSQSQNEYLELAQQCSVRLREEEAKNLAIVERAAEAEAACKKVLKADGGNKKATSFLAFLDEWRQQSEDWGDAFNARAGAGSGKVWESVGYLHKDLTALRNDMRAVAEMAIYDEELERTNLSLLRATSRLYPWLRQEWQRARREVLTFNDLKLETRRFLTDPSVGAAVAAGIRYLMVDEFQDTDPVQWEIFERLTLGGDTNLFVVGDTKQSIYRFRGADVSVFVQAIERVQTNNRMTGTVSPPLHPITGQPLPEVMEGSPTKLGEEAATGLIRLTANFRSTLATLELGNTIFRSVFDLAGPGQQPARELQSFDALADDMTLIRTPDPTLPPRVTVLPLVKDPGKESETGEGSEYSPEDVRFSLSRDVNLSHLIAEHLLELHTQGVAWQRMAVLARTHVNIAVLRSVFPQYGIPYQVSGGKQLFGTLEAREFLTLASALADPFEDYHMLGLLRSSFVGLPDSLLTLLCGDPAAGSRKRKVPLVKLLRDPDLWPNKLTGQEKGLLKSRAAWFDSLVYRVGDESSHALLQEALVTSGAWGHSVSSGRGQRAANLHKLLEVAYDFEQEEGPDMLAFSDELRLRIDANENADEGEVAGASDAVQVMTIHAAKGKEFDVVALPFLGKSRTDFDRLRLSRQVGEDKTRPLIAVRPQTWGLAASDEDISDKPVLWQMLGNETSLRELAEDRRLFYVAWTRARHHLILCPTLETHKGSADAFIIPDPERQYNGLGDFLLQGLGLSKTDTGYLGLRDKVLAQLPEALRPLVRLHDPVPGRMAPLGVAAPVVQKSNNYLAFAAQHATPSAWGAKELELAAPLQTSRRSWRFTASNLDVAVFSGEAFAKVPLLEVDAANGQAKDSGLSEAEFGTLVHTVIEAELGGHSEVLALAGYAIEDIAAAKPHSQRARQVLHAGGKPLLELLEYEVTIGVEDAMANTAIDYVCKVADGHWKIIDFKTGGDKADYRAQLAVYALGLKRRLELGGERVERIDTALLFTGEGRLYDIASFRGEDFGRIEKRLASYLRKAAG